MRGASILLALLLLLLLLPGGGTLRRAGAAPARETHLGAGSCAAQACHGSHPERMEYKTWKTKDRHSRAYESLEGPVGKRIGERLGIDPTKSEMCLNCHGTTGAELAPSFDPVDGVSCELCHGAASGWLGPHATAEWKERTAAQKAELGMRDLSTPEARAQACVGCHLGAAGREIPHRIMAAGHPALAFDAAYDLVRMPPHWKDEEPANPVATWVASLRTAAAASLARTARAAHLRTGWPEFGVFDCYACHHAIHSGGAYEQGPLPGGPGDLPLDVAELRVLLVALGDKGVLERYAGLLSRTMRPDEQQRDFATYVDAMAAEVRGLFADVDRYGAADGRRFRENLAAHLQRALKGEVRLPLHEMQQIAMAVASLAPARGQALFEEAHARLMALVGPGKPYDVAASARAALDALARAG